MGTRTIVTFHPDVECDVCGRRLLRGELSDVFITGGQRRMVCELCTARATHEGWLRESDGHSKSTRAARPQRGLSLLGRLRQRGLPGSAASDPDAGRGGPPRGGRAAGSRGGMYDFLDSSSPELAGPGVAGGVDDGPTYGDPGLQEVVGVDGLHGADAALADSAVEPIAGRQRAGVELAPTTGELKVARALEVFNSSEQPRRMAGVARSLGTPTARAAPLADSGSVVGILIAWELCWYRYEVDLGDEAAGVRLAGQGMELDELAAEERLPNAAADERGMLALLDI
jgi:hypothetical protein